MQAPFSDFWWTIGIGTVTLVVLAVAFVAALIANQRRFIANQRLQLDDLRRSEEKYRNLFENSLVGMVRLSLDDLTILDCNKTTCAIFGGRTQEEVRRGFKAMKEQEQVMLRRILRDQGAIENFEAELTTEAGPSLWVSITCRANVREGYAEGVVIDISKRKTAEDELRESHHQLRSLSSRLESIREEERIRIARQVHDELGQILTAVKIHLTLLGETAMPSVKKQSARAPRKLDTLIGIIDEAIDLVKNISNDLRPLALEEAGLKEAIEWETSQFEHRTGIRCTVKCTEDDIVMKQENATAVFRIFQEALTNIARHAHAGKVEVRIRQTDQEFSMEIIDDGRGITDEEAKNPKALGILGMRERAALLGGSLSVARSNGLGTTVGLVVPIRQHEGASF